MTNGTGTDSLPVTAENSNTSHSQSRRKLYLSLLKVLPILVLQFLVIMSIFCLINSKSYLLTAPSSSSESALYAYKVDQCQDLSSEQKQHRVTCCSDPTLPVLGGIDVVDLAQQPSYTLPQLGLPYYQYSLTTTQGDYTFFFISEENKLKFASNPWQYAPAYGGFCACGIALEERFADPSFKDKLGPYVDLSKWSMINGRLFFFSGSNPLESFLMHEGMAIPGGDTHWASYYDGKLYDGAFNTNCFHRQEYEDLVNGIENEFVCPVHNNNKPVDFATKPCGC